MYYHSYGRCTKTSLGGRLKCDVLIQNVAKYSSLLISVIGSF